MGVLNVLAARLLCGGAACFGGGRPRATEDGDGKAGCKVEERKVEVASVQWQREKKRQISELALRERKEVEFTDLATASPAKLDVFVDNEGDPDPSPAAFQVQQSVFLDKENGYFVESKAAAVSDASLHIMTPPPPEGFNGIPNGSRKYNERRGITTHCTPFEERIERALKELDENNL